LAPLSKDIPSDVVSEVNAISDKIGKGEFHPFTGPIKNQQGELIIDAGKTIDDKTLLGMDFYVEGVEGQLK
ncbi:MAG: BMP family ABC transporter substrate-binding protein, partial [Pseudoalteromonas sp.]